MVGTGTFPVSVDGVGDFVFKRRSLDAQFKIEAAAVRFLGGETASDSLYRMAMSFATVSHLAVTVPDGWNIDEIDPLDNEQLDRVHLVFRRLRAAEETFRAGAKSQRPSLGTSA